MSHHQLPAGCHDAETAAQLLNMSKLALLQRMRELGWLNTGGGPSNHNLPRREYARIGYLCTQDRGYSLKGKREISKTYRVMLLTQLGFNALKKELEKMKTQTISNEEYTPPVIAHLPPPTQMYQQKQEEPEVPFDRAAAEKERDEALKQMRKWGLTS